MKRSLILSTLLSAVAAQTASEIGSDLCTREQLLTLDTNAVKYSALSNYCTATSDFLTDECDCEQDNYDQSRRASAYFRTCYNDPRELASLTISDNYIIETCREYDPVPVNKTFTLRNDLVFSQTSSCNASIPLYTRAIDDFYACIYTNLTDYSSENVADCFCRNAQNVIDGLTLVNIDCDDDSAENSDRSLYDTFLSTGCTGLTVRGSAPAVTTSTTTRTSRRSTTSRTTTRRTTTSRSTTSRTTTSRTTTARVTPAGTSTTEAATTAAATTAAATTAAPTIAIPTTAVATTPEATAPAATTVAPTAVPVTTQASSGAQPIMSEIGSRVVVCLAIFASIVSAFVL